MNLLSYEQVNASISGKTSHLLIGNGFSIAYSSKFSYDSLYEVAVENGLSDNAKKVFKKLGTNNFEAVLKLLENLSWAMQVYYDVSDKGQKINDDIKVIKETLINSISQSHLNHSGEVKDSCKQSAQNFLRPYKNIFTTNYDLLLYWVNMSYPNRPFYGDGFRSEYENPDANYVVFSEHLRENPGIFNIHGGLHLYFSDGEIKKHCWSRTHKPLMELIRESLDNDRYPLFVAEGLPDKKLEQINSNAYLAYCLSKFSRIENRLVVLGNGLAMSDKHICDVISDNVKLKDVYVGLYGSPDSQHNKETLNSCQAILDRRAIINRNLPNKKKGELVIQYYDSATADIWGHK